MNDERKTLYISAAINFVIGIVLGTVLFYGQIKGTGTEIVSVYEYDKTTSLSDFFRLSWLNILWMLSVFFARCILPLGFIHPIITVRGLISSFSMLYILSVFGVREAVASIFPQCVSVLPLLLYFSVETVTKYRENLRNGNEPCCLRRHEIASIFVWSMLSGVAEVFVFRILCKYLF
ncbi:MAG: hypothetical protein IJD91_02535 [Clostridia bacterium]|nr:hypothetical protein [Clostridia bacterium]